MIYDQFSISFGGQNWGVPKVRGTPTYMIDCGISDDVWLVVSFVSFIYAHVCAYIASPYIDRSSNF